jgi:hypothetical protein
MAFQDDYKKFLAQEELRKQSVGGLGRNNQAPVRDINTPIQLGAKEGPGMGSVGDLAKGFTWNLLDSVLLGAPQAFTDETQYDLENIADQTTMGKIGTSLGQGLGFFAPFLGIAKGASTLLKGAKYVDKLSDGTKVVRGITTAGRTQDALSGLKELTNINKLNRAANSTIGGSSAEKLVAEALKSRKIKPHLKFYEISDEAIQSGKQMFSDDLTAGIVETFKKYKGTIDVGDAKIAADQIIKGLQKGGLHKNNTGEILFKMFGHNMKPGFKRNLMGYTANAAENFMTFNLYNAATGAIQEIANDKDYDFWASHAQSMPASFMFSLAAPMVDFIPGGKATNITSDAGRVMKLLFKSPTTKNMSKKQVDANLKLWSRYDNAGLRSIIGNKKYYDRLKNPRSLDSINRIGGIKNEKVARELLEDVWKVNKRDLLKRFTIETRKDLIGSLPRMTADAVLFSGINYGMEGQAISRLGVEDTWVNAMIGAFMAKKRRPIPGLNWETRARYLDNVDSYINRPTYEEQLGLLNSIGVSTEKIENMVNSYDRGEYIKTKGVAYLQNPHVADILRIFDDSYIEPEGRDSGDGFSSNDYYTIHNAYKKFYTMAKIAGTQDFNNFKEIDFSKYSKSEMDALEKRLNEISIGDIGGEPAFLKGNITRLLSDVIGSSSQKVLDGYLNAATDLANIFGSDLIQTSNGKVQFSKVDIAGPGAELYHRTLDILERMHPNVSIESMKELTKVTATSDEIKKMNLDAENKVQEYSEAMSMEHFGFNRTLSWGDNDLLNEVQTAAQLKELEDLALMNLENLETGNQKLDDIANYLNGITTANEWFHNVYEGFEVKLNGENVEPSIENDKILQDFQMIYGLMGAGKKKITYDSAGKKKTLDFDKVKELTEKFRDENSMLSALNDEYNIVDKMNQYVVTRRFEGSDIKDTSYSLLKHVLDRGIFKADDFPDKGAAERIVREQMEYNGFSESDITEVLESVRAVYRELDGMGDIFTYNSNFVRAEASTSSKEEGGKIFTNPDLEVNYAKVFEEMKRHTSEAFIKEIHNQAVMLKSSLEKTMENVPETVKELQAIIGEGAKDFTNIEESLSRESIEKINEHLDKILEDTNISNRVREDITSFRDEVVKWLSEGHEAGNMTGIATILKKAGKTGSNRYEQLKAIKESEMYNKRDLSEALHRVIFMGSSPENRHKAIEAYDTIRSHMLEDALKAGTHESRNLGLKELLDIYNETGDFKDFKKFVDDALFAFHKVWDPEQLKHLEDSYNQQIEAKLAQLKDSATFINIDSIAKKYLDPNHSMLTDGSFSREKATRIAVKAALVNRYNKGTVEYDGAVKDLVIELEIVTNAFLESPKLASSSAQKDFLKKEFGPIINTFVNNTGGTRLKFKNGALVFNNDTRTYTPTDRFIDNVNSKLFGDRSAIMELENSGINNGRVTNINEVDNIDEMLSKPGEIKLLDALGQEVKDLVGNRAIVPGVLSTPGVESGSNLVRVGISNYKNIIYNATAENDASLMAGFKRWFDGKKGQLENSTKFERMFKGIIDKIDKGDSTLTIGERRAMLRSIYYDSTNSNQLKGLIEASEGSAANLEAANLKYIKYQHVIEGAQTSQLSKVTLDFVSETFKENNIGIDYIADREYFSKKGDKVNVAVIDDEAPNKEGVLNPFNNRNMIVKALEFKRDGLPEGSAMRTLYDEQIENVKNNKWESLGDDQDKVVSMVNGITYVKSQLANVISTVRGIDVGTEGHQGIKPVVRHNSFDFGNMSGDGSTLVQKTMMIHDPEFDEMFGDYDMITFNSAAKSFSGDMIKPSGDFSTAVDDNAVLGKILSENSSGDFLIDLDDIGVNYLTKDVHRAPGSPSIYSSLIGANTPLGRETQQDFYDWIGFTGNNNKVQAIEEAYQSIAGMESTGAVKYLLNRAAEEGWNLDDPSLSGFNQLMNAGLDAESPLVKYEVQRLLKSNFLDTISRPLSNYGITSPLVPTRGKVDHTLTNPVFDDVGHQVIFGGIKVSEKAVNQSIDKDGEGINFIVKSDSFDIPGQEVAIGMRKGKIKVTLLDEAAGNPETIKKVEKELGWVEDVYKLIKKSSNAKVDAEATYLNVFEYIKHIQDNPTDGQPIHRLGDVEFSSDYSLKRKIRESGIGVALSGMRIPKQSGSDFVINRIEDVFRGDQGNRVSVNAFELATKHQGDFDVDKLFYYLNTPITVMSSLHQKSGRVVDQGAFDSNLITNDLNIFEIGSDGLAGSSTEDGLTPHAKNISQAAKLLGQSVKLLTSIPTLENIGLEIQGSKIGSTKDIEQTIANLISTAVDHHAGTPEWIVNTNNREIIRWALFGGDPEGKFPKRGENFEPIAIKVDKYSRGEELGLVEQDLVVEALMTVGKLSRVFSGIFDEKGGRSPDVSEIESIYEDVNSFYKDAPRYLFEKLFYKYMKGSDFKPNNNVHELLTIFVDKYTMSNSMHFDKVLEAFKSGKTDNITFSSGETMAVKLLKGLSSSDAFDKSPAGLIVKAFGSGTLIKDSQEGGVVRDDYIADIDANLNTLLGRIKFHRSSGKESLVSELIDSSIAKPDAAPRPKMSDIQKSQERGAYYDLLEHKRDKALRSLNAISADEFGDKDKITSLRDEISSIEAVMTRLDLVTKKELNITMDELKKSNGTAIVENQASYTNNTNNVQYVYKAGGKDKAGDYRPSDLEPVQILKKDESVTAYGDYVILKNPVRPKTLNDTSYLDGQAWFATIEGGSENFKKLPLLEDLETAVDDLKKEYKALSKSLAEKSQSHKAQNVYETAKMQYHNSFNKIYDIITKHSAGNTNTKKAFIEHAAKALLRPKAVFSAVHKGKGGEVLPVFYQDPKFSKEILTFMLQHSDPIVSQTARDIIYTQGEEYRKRKYNIAMSPEVMKRHREQVLQREYMMDNYNYADSESVQFGSDQFFNDLIFSNFGTPAAVISRLQHRLKGNSDVKVFKTLNRETGETLLQAKKYKDQINLKDGMSEVGNGRTRWKIC